MDVRTIFNLPLSIWLVSQRSMSAIDFKPHLEASKCFRVFLVNPRDSIRSGQQFISTSTSFVKLLKATRSKFRSLSMILLVPTTSEPPLIFKELSTPQIENADEVLVSSS